MVYQFIALPYINGKDARQERRLTYRHLHCSICDSHKKIATKATNAAIPLQFCPLGLENAMSTITNTTPAIVTPAVVNINNVGNFLSTLTIDESLPLNQRIVQCAEVFTQSKAVEKYASEYIINALSVSTTDEMMEKLQFLQLWPNDWKMPRSVYNAIEKRTQAYKVKDDGFVEYKKSKTLVLYSFIIAFSRVYNLLEKRASKAMQTMQQLLKDADIALSALKDAQSEDDILSRLDYAEKCIDCLPVDKQPEYINRVYCIIDGKKSIFFPVIEKPKTVGGLQFTTVLDYDACFFDAILFSYIPAIYDEFNNDYKLPVEIYESEECQQYFDIYIPALIKKLAREERELQERAEKIAKEKLAKEGIENALLLQKYTKALKDIETAMGKIAVDISKTKRADCNETLASIREALKNAKL